VFRLILGLFILEAAAAGVSLVSDAWSCGPAEASSCSTPAQISLPATLVVIPALIALALIVAITRTISRGRSFH
jgi:hypothetical protein